MASASLIRSARLSLPALELLSISPAISIQTRTKTATVIRNVAHLPPEQRSKASWKSSTTLEYDNVIGKKHLAKVMPDVIKIAKERRPHLFPENVDGMEVMHQRGGATLIVPPKGQGKMEAADPAHGEVQGNEAQGRELAKVPDFARFAEFRESHLDFEPSKLHVAWRSCKMSGRPRYEKTIMQRLRLDRPIGNMEIVKNTPKTNRDLWMVKHMIRMKPLSMPQGGITEENYKGMLLKRNGEFVPSKYYRDNYLRQRGRPELERFVLLRAEKSKNMRHKWFHGSIDGSLLEHTSSDGAINKTQDSSDLPEYFVPGSDKWK